MTYRYLPARRTRCASYSFPYYGFNLSISFVYNLGSEPATRLEDDDIRNGRLTNNDTRYQLIFLILFGSYKDFLELILIKLDTTSLENYSSASA